jgi:CubicO group peptidase (beta-lactamase class C family)
MYPPKPLLIAALLLALLLRAGQQGTRAADTTAPDVAAIDAYVQAEMRADRVPGAALAIVHGKEVVHMRGFGDDGAGNPVTPQTAFILGSMSKSFTAVAIMQLVEQGKLQLDVPAQRYLPWFRVADPDASARITVRHLLNHTSGIPTKAPHATDEPLTIEAHVRALATVVPRHAPGEVFEYASPNYLVLGAIIERVTGQSYAAYVQRSIFAPLDMRHSFTSQTAALQSTMARGHRYWFGFPRPAVLSYEADRMPTAALISSAEDLAHVLLAQLNDGRYGVHALLSPESVVEMQRPAIQAEGFSYAMGWLVSEMHGATAVHHGGVVSHFHGKMVLLPREGWGVVVLTNVSSVLSSMLPVAPTSHRITDNIAGALVGKPLPTPGSPLQRIHLAITAGIALLTFGQIKDLVALRRWRSRLLTKSRQSLIMGLSTDILLPAALLLGLPAVLDLPWSEVLRSMPDVGYWLIGSSVLGVLTGLWKAVVAYQATWSRKAPGTGHEPAHPSLSTHVAE